VRLPQDGDCTRSLTAYDRALSLAPEYAKAIEYRAAAYRGLNRVADAQRAYEWLFLHDPDACREAGCRSGRCG
jgi:tetratricopeptide (TPR) repeat protein